MPKRILDGIIEMIYALDKIAPGTANDDTLLYGVEVKFYNMQVEIDNNLETRNKGLYIIGDCSGVTHSLSHASASGVYVARHILNQLNWKEKYCGRWIDNGNGRQTDRKFPSGLSLAGLSGKLWYIEGVLTPGGEEQDAYIIGVDIPVDKFTGRKIAIIHRKDDVGDKWVVAPENMPYTKQQIEEMVYFQEQYYDSFVQMLNEEMWDACDAWENKLGS